MIPAEVVDALATYRLTRLIVDDKITTKLRNTATNRWGQHGIGYLVNCPWCTSVWVGVGAVAVRRLFPKVWAPVAEAMAFSAAAGWLSSHE